MPRGKKTPDPVATGSSDDTTKETQARKPAPSRGRNGATSKPPARRVTAEPAQGVVAVGYPVEGLQEQFLEIQRELAEIARQAREARSSVQALRDEREQIVRELGELRQQVRAAQEQSLRETREGYSKVGQEFTTTAGRLGEAVRNAQQELTEVVRHAREARREVEEYRRQAQAARQDGPGRGATAGREEEPEDRRERADTRPEPQNRLGVTVASGVIVSEVIPDSPADTAGLTRGDVIEEVNGTGVVTAAQLRDAVQKVDDGGEVTLRVFRGGEPEEIKVPLATVADEAEGNEVQSAEGHNRLGVTVGVGIVVAEVLPDSPAAAAGLARGDVIDDLNGTPLQTGEQLRDVVRHLPAGEEAVLRVTRAGEIREVRAKLNGG